MDYEPFFKNSVYQYKLDEDWYICRWFEAELLVDVSALFFHIDCHPKYTENVPKSKRELSQCHGGKCETCDKLVPQDLIKKVRVIDTIRRI